MPGTGHAPPSVLTHVFASKGNHYSYNQQASLGRGPHSASLRGELESHEVDVPVVVERTERREGAVEELKAALALESFRLLEGDTLKGENESQIKGWRVKGEGSGANATGYGYGRRRSARLADA